MRLIFRFVLSFSLLFTGIGIYLTNRLMYIRKKADEEIALRDEKAGFLNHIDFNSLPKKEISIHSPFGYPLKAVLIEPWNTNRYMIFCHGVTENKISSVKYMNLFIERGFNAIIYDQRRHGESGGKTTSYGYYEKFDLKAVVDWLKNRHGDGVYLGIHGESMGAATILQYAGLIEDGANFYIADCPYSVFEQQLASRVRAETGLPPSLMLPFARVFIYIRDHYRLKEVSPLAAVEHIKNPVLFIHSQEDDYIPPSMTEELYKQKIGAKKLYLAKKGVHARSLAENSQEYEKALDEFLSEFCFKADTSRKL